MIDTKALRELEKKATPGKWAINSYMTYLLNGGIRYQYFFTSSNKPNKTFPKQPGIIAILEHTLTDDTAAFKPEDQDLLVAARNALIPLCDELDALRAENAQLRKHVGEMEI